MVSVDHYASWKKLKAELCARTVEPTRHVSFVLYFVVAVVVFGGLGIWAEVWHVVFYVPTGDTPSASLKSLRTAIVTFFPALAGTAGLQIILAEDRARPLRAFGFLVIAISFIPVFLISPTTVPDARALFFGIVASIISLWVWWIANAKQADFMDEPPNYDAATGNTRTDVPLAGDRIKEFKT